MIGQSPVMGQDNEYAQPGDERLFVQFYTGTMQDKEATEREGRPVFKSVPFVKILIPGDRNNVIDTFANVGYQKRFAAQWARFLTKESQEVQGTLLSEVPIVTRAQAEELEYFKVFTVEQLAEVPDTLASKVPYLQQLKRKARDYVTQAKDSAVAMKLAEENEQLRGQIAAQGEQLAQLSARFDEMVRGVKESGNAERHRPRNRTGVL